MLEHRQKYPLVRFVQLYPNNFAHQDYSKLILNFPYSQIKIKSDSLPVSWEKDGLICSNGSRLKADIVVFATGFIGNLRLLVTDIFGPDMAGQVGDFWGLDEEGELKGAFKPSGRKYLVLVRELMLIIILQTLPSGITEAL